MAFGSCGVFWFRAVSPAAVCGGLPSAKELPYNVYMKAVNWVLSFSVFFAVPLSIGLYSAHLRESRSKVDVEKKEVKKEVSGPIDHTKVGFPKHWGDPPAIQTRDARYLPPPYIGWGSSTLVNWILENQAKDAN